MDTIVNAVFRNGVFIPTTICDLPENAEVQVIVGNSTTAPQVVADPEERANPPRSRRADDGKPHSRRRPAVDSRATS